MDSFDQIGCGGPAKAGAAFKNALGGSPGAFAGFVLDGNQSCYRVTATCDGHAFALGDTIEKAWQMSLGFVGADALHQMAPR